MHIQLTLIKLKCVDVQCFKNFYGHFSVQICARYMFGGNLANVDCVTIGHCTKYVDDHLMFCKVSVGGSE